MSRADLEKWDRKYAGRAPGEPSSSLQAFGHFLPARGRALDVAGGNGRNALWLLARGLEVTLVDISEVALATARAHGGRLTTLALDLETSPLPRGPWDLIVCIAFLDRALYETFPALLAPGGTLVVVHPTVKNLERHPGPPRDFLLEPGELPGRFSGLEVLHSDEGWSSASESATHQARLVARRPS